MRFGKFFAILILLSLSACAGSFTPSPTATETIIPSPEITNTASPIPTLSNEQLTAYATYRPTLPPTFTATFTPTITLTPTITTTPPASPTRTPIPENLFCPTFDAADFAPQGRPIGVSFDIPQDYALYVEILDGETQEVLTSQLMENRETVTLIFDPRRITPGHYIWRVSLQDETRTGMCPLQGEFTIIAPPPTATSELTAEVTAELTAESTEAMTASPTVRPSATRRPSSTPRPTATQGN